LAISYWPLYKARHQKVACFFFVEPAMLNQKKVEIIPVKIRKSLAKQFLEIAFNICNKTLQ